MKYRMLFEVRMRHTYYKDQRCPDFLMEAHEATARLLKNHRGMVRHQPDGILVLIAVDEDGRPFLPLSNSAVFRFDLALKNTDFPRFTDLAEISAHDAPRFSNAALRGQTGTALSLDTGLSSSTPPRKKPSVFAEVEIHNNDTLPKTGNPVVVSRRFEISFSARSARWSYYCVTDFKASQGALRVVDASPSVSGRLSFSDQNQRDLGLQPDSRDEIAKTLAVQYPQFRKIRFFSDAAVPCRQAARQHLEFHLGENKLAEALPNPSFRNHFRLSTGEGDSLKEEDALFQVIKYVAE
ncbi:MAG: hypothetical protein ACE5F7_03640 [Nitrospiria bacterium]